MMKVKFIGRFLRGTAIFFALAGFVPSVFAAAMPEDTRETSKGHYCSICHKLDENSIGPSWMAISKFYNGKINRTFTGKTLKEVTGGMPIEEFLIKRVSMGGDGNWGSQPMLPNNYVYGREDPAKREFIKTQVEFIMGLAK